MNRPRLCEMPFFTGVYSQVVDKNDDTLFLTRVRSSGAVVGSMISLCRSTSIMGSESPSHVRPVLARFSSQTISAVRKRAVSVSEDATALADKFQFSVNKGEHQMVRKEPAPRALKDLSIAELRELLTKKIAQEQKRLRPLKVKRSKLEAEIEKIDAEIAEIEGVAPPRRKGRPRMSEAVKKPPKRRGRPPIQAGAPKATRRRGGRVTIPQAIATVLSSAGKPMSVTEIRETILKQKLIPKISKSFGTQVAIALSKREEFKRVGRGMYSL